MSADTALVEGLTASVFPNGLCVVARDPQVLPAETDPAEAAAVCRAVPHRVAEFHAGRAAVRAAMLRLGEPPTPVLMGADRAPLWPDALVGSISHSAEACVAVVGHRRDWSSIGVDIEEATPLDPLLVAEICTKTEQRWLASQPADVRGVMAKLVFSAKEAAYKAQYPITGRLFGFHTLEVTIDPAEARFEALFLSDEGPFSKGSVVSGRYAHAAGVLVTGVALRQAETLQSLNTAERQG